MAYGFAKRYTKEKLEELAKNFPPPGHPHYMPVEERFKAEIEAEAAEAESDIPAPRRTVWRKDDTMTTAAGTKYQELKAKIAKAKAEMEATAKSAFSDMAKEFFDENPGVLAFGWNQYTPYWNDGEECTFSANTDYPSVAMEIEGTVMFYNSSRGEITDKDGEDIRTAENWQRNVFEAMPKVARVSPIVVDGKSIAYDWTTKLVTIDGVKAKTRADYEGLFEGAETKVSKFLKNFDDDDLETMFGDHVEITVNRDGSIESEEYQHD